ncbi:MAG: hypothetical protein HYW47_04465 [Deltaproteobacteria bacterium]|nr:hypothetical protein [Deltaproteobacteria bacterium]
MKSAICIVGWHFNKEFYNNLAHLKTDLYLISHKEDNTPQWTQGIFKKNRIFIEKNIGYDWGAFQQFYEKGIWKNYDYVLFIHDDIEILDDSFLSVLELKFKEGYHAVGNGRNDLRKNWPQIQRSAYAHSDWLPPSRNFEHETIRGSFIALSHTVLSKIDKFEVFWDPYHLTMKYGNASLIANCGKMQYVMGDQKIFTFLSEEYLKSDYVIELERNNMVIKVPFLKRKVEQLLRLVSNIYMSLYYKKKSSCFEQKIQTAFKKLIHFFSRRKNY